MMVTNKKRLLMVGLAVALTGCATTPKPAPQYVSTTRYQGYNCSQLEAEYRRLNQYIQTRHSAGGLTVSGVGLGLGVGRGGIFPSINLGVGRAGGGNQQNLNIAMGEHDAIVQSGRDRQCSFAQGVRLFSENKAS